MTQKQKIKKNEISFSIDTKNMNSYIFSKCIVCGKQNALTTEEFDRCNDKKHKQIGSVCTGSCACAALPVVAADYGIRGYSWVSLKRVVVFYELS
jgi:hypothetical protein